MNDNSGVFMLPMLMPLLVIGLAGVLLWFAWHQNKKRRAAAQAFAASRGWAYTPSVPGLVNRWHSAPFRIGSSRRASNVLTGTFHDRQVVSFDYQYTTGSGKNRSTSYFHVVALSLPAALPWLRLSPDGAGAAMARFFGGQDVDFESEAFNRAWRVQASPPPQYAYDFVHPRMIERLMAPDAVGRSITVEGADIFLVRSGHQVLEAIDLYVNLLYGIDALIPRHLWLKVGYDPLARR